MAEWINTARYIREKLPSEAKLAVHDVGVLGYLTPNPLFDLEGLLSPEVAFLRADSSLSLEEKEKRIVEKVWQAGCEYLVIHRWYKRRIASLPVELLDEGREGRMMSVWKILSPAEVAAEMGRCSLPIEEAGSEFKLQFGAGHHEAIRKRGLRKRPAPV